VSQSFAPKGCFITLEGGEGVGKSTLCARLAPMLSSLLTDIKTAEASRLVLTREPGGTAASEAIRSLMLHPPEQVRFDSEVQALLAYAARRAHLETLVRPALARGDWVLCDRFHDSSWAYQHYAGSAPSSLLEALDTEVIGITMPDLTFLMTASEDTRLRRRRQRDGDSVKDSFERMDVGFHRRVCDGFEARAAACPNRIVTLDTNTLAPDVLAAMALDIISSRLLRSRA